MRIRGLFALGMGSICLLTSALVANQVIQDWRAYQETAAGASVTRDYAAVMRTFQSLVTERAPTNTLVSSPAPYDSDRLDILKKARAGADKALDGLQRQLDDSIGDYRAQSLAIVAGVQKNLAAARQTVDAVKDAGDPPQQIAAGRQAMAQLLAAPAEFDTMLTAMQRNIADSDPRSATLADIARITNDIRDNGGKLVNRLSPALNGKRPFSAGEAAAEDKGRGEVGDMLDNMALKIDMVSNNAPLKQAYGVFEERFLQDVLKTLDAEIEIAHHDAKFTTTYGEFTKAFVPAISTIYGVRDAALHLAIDRATARMDHARSQLVIAIGLMVLIIGLVTAISIYFRRRLVLPLVELTMVIMRIAEGARDLAVPHTGRKDEIGEIAGALGDLLDKARHADRLAAEREVENLAKQARAEKLEQLAGSFEAAVSRLTGSLNDAARGMKSTASTMSSTAQQTTAQSSSVSAASEETSHNVQTVATATEQLSRSIEEIGQRVEQSTVITARAVEDARHTDVIIRTLSDRAQNIGQVISLISGIAHQTNLLALNATIEAARAGESGKGFAVVASEVKNLAGQTNKATEDIATQIGEIQNATSEAVGAIRGITATVDEINAISAAIAAAIEEQGAATREIARSVVEAARTTQDVSSNIAGVREAAMQTGAAATTVLDAADLLANQSTHLGAEVEGFVAAVKAA
ncbi:MAG TPA: methyl-accepting chemotaxis protein [Stellaceae bacterium]|jgi:methyl-accepting chemotaxis protein|nr:methyl-accepting chemotaxis protein [Stellaceae bacterium]